MKEIYFSKKYPEEEMSSDKKSILCFFNLHNIWWARSKEYKGILKEDRFKIFPDGKTVSRLLRIPQRRGPTFTKEFFLSKEAKIQKHFFIGLEESDIKEFSKITGINPSKIIPYHSSATKNPNIVSLPEEEVEKISLAISKSNPDTIWIGISSPKQEFIASQLFDKVETKHLVCIGAGKDFLLKKKKEAPSIWQSIGLEWLYRLITDFNHSKVKVWRSFVALSYIARGKLKLKLSK